MPNTSSIRARLRRHLTSIRDAAGRLVRQIRRTWQAHRDRLANDPAYGGALAGVVVAACELFTRDPRVIAVVAAVTTAYVTISRAVRRGDWDAGDDWPGGRTPTTPDTRHLNARPSTHHRPRHPPGAFVMSRRRTIMSRETLQHLNTNTLIGNTDAPRHRLALPRRGAGRGVQPLPRPDPGRRRASAGCSTGRPSPAASPSRCPPTSTP